MEKRELSLPSLNPLDLVGSLNNLLSFNRTVSEVAHRATVVGSEGKNKIQEFAQETINNTKRSIHSLVEGVSSQLKKKLEDGPFANTMRGVACLKNSTSAAMSSGTEVCKYLIILLV